MNPVPKDRYSPDKLLEGFRNTGFLKWLAVAVAIHLAFAAATSVGFVLDTIYPERVAEREAAAKAQKDAEAQKKALVERKAAEAAAPASTQAAPAGVASTSSSGTNEAEGDLLQQNKDHPIVKQITEAAPANAIPSKPDDIGISIEQTNIR